MKLASLKNIGQKDLGRDGCLIVVSRDMQRAQRVKNIIGTLQEALENWSEYEPELQQVYKRLNQVHLNQKLLPEQFLLDVRQLAAPLPRAYQWLDGSAYLSHVERVRKARGAELPEALLTDPLMYQGASDDFSGACEPIYAADETWGIDLEGEVTIVTDDVPYQCTLTEAAQHIRLIMLINDVSLRNLIPSELAKGFGFIQGKPSSCFSPVAVTPDELGEFWHDCKVHRPLYVSVNGTQLGRPDAGDGMQFNFARLITHAAKTRRLMAGTIIGSGTVSNADESKGCCCLVEKRVLEIISSGEAKTPFLKVGDQVEIEMFNEKGDSIFGAINQEVKLC